MTVTVPPAVREAADWLRRQVPHPSPVIPVLRKRFGLSPREAVEAIRLQSKGGAE